MTAPQLTPFRPGWYSFDLGQYRPCDGTYCLSPYEDLPPVPAPDESLAWLGPLDERTDQQMQIHRDRQVASGKLDQIVASAQRLELTLPPSFLRLMGRRSYRSASPPARPATSASRTTSSRVPAASRAISCAF